jgi:streptogramin lyase
MKMNPLLKLFKSEPPCVGCYQKIGGKVLGLAAGGLLAVNAAWGQGQGWVNGLDYATPYTFVTIAGSFGNYGDADGTNGTAQFWSPAGVTVDTNDNVYVVDNVENNIRKLTPMGPNWVVTTITGTDFNSPYGIAMDAGGDLYVADSNNNSVSKLTPSSDSWVSSTIATGLNYPCAIAVDAATNVYVADTYNNVIRRLTLAGNNWTDTIIAGTVTPFPGGGTNDGTNQFAQFNLPTGLAVDGASNLFVGDSGNSTIRKVTPAGTNWVVTTIAGMAGNSGQADGTNGAARFYATFVEYGPMGVAVDANDNLYVADGGNGLIRKVSPVGANWVTTTLAGSSLPPSGDVDGTGTNALFGTPDGIAVDAAGRLFVSDAGNNEMCEGTLAVVTAAPRLSLSVGTHALTITWPGTGFTLQTNASLTTKNWGVYGGTVNSSNGTNSVTVLSPMGDSFFRLSQ